MKSIALRFSLVGAIVVASVAAPLQIQSHARGQRRERTALLQQQAERFAELSAENKRLSNLVAQTRLSSLSEDQFMELLRLRGEIGQLRQNAREVASLQATHQQLLAAARNLEPQAGPALPDPKTVQAYWPKAQLTFAGYADQVSALQTTLWAMSRNDPDVLAASVTAKTKSNLVERAAMDGGSPAERLAWQAKTTADSFGPASGFYVLGHDLAERILKGSPGLQILNVYFEQEGTTRRFVLSKIGDEWKVEGIYGIGGNDSEPGPTLWP